MQNGQILHGNARVDRACPKGSATPAFPGAEHQRIPILGFSESMFRLTAWAVYGLVYDGLGSSGMRWSRISCRCAAVKSERVSFAQKISTKLQVQLQIRRTTTFGVVTHMGRGRV